MAKRALILGIGGQDGSYLADILLEKGYEVHGMHRRSSTGNLKNIQHILDKIVLHRGDMGDPLSVTNIVKDVYPDEIYNEADQDHVGWSQAVPAYNADITYGAVCRLLEIVRKVNSTIRVFQPCSAMMFGSNSLYPQNETSQFYPQSPYAVSKVAAYYICKYYRETYGMFVSTGILYNHDSPRRSEEYLLNKICRSVVRISQGKQDKLVLGNLDTKVDIGYAREYMGAAWAMLQIDSPRDFVIGSGVAYSIKTLAMWAFDDVGVSEEDAERLLTMDPTFARPRRETVLISDIHRARAYLNFNPSPVRDLIRTIITDYKEGLGCK